MRSFQTYSSGMPRINLKTPTDTVGLHYNIRAPPCHSSLKIESALPCILFFHAEYLSQEMFEGAFYPQLRDHFNLVAIDQRSYDDTILVLSGGKIYSSLGNRVLGAGYTYVPRRGSDSAMHSCHI